MPKLPTAIAQLVESRGTPCTVTRIEDLTPRLRRVHLHGEGFRGHDWVPGQVTTFRVSGTEFRRYTPDSFDPETGQLSILFYRHNGDSTVLPPGERWLAGLQPGGTITAIGLTATSTFQGRPTPGDVLVVGDATTVGLWYSMIHWQAITSQIRGVVEVPADDLDVTHALLPGVDVVAETFTPGGAILDRLALMDAPDVSHAYISGHAQTIPAARQLIRARTRLDRKQISTQPYWATGKVGL